MTKPITTTSTDDDLIKYSIRTVHDTGNDRIVIEVEVVHWPHPHAPESEWVPAAEHGGYPQGCPTRRCFSPDTLVGGGG